MGAAESVFQDLVSTYWRLNPTEATHAGSHIWDHALPDLGPDGAEQRAGWRADVRATLSQLPSDRLDASDHLDVRVLEAEVNGQEALEAWRFAQRAPAHAVELAMASINDLLARPDPQATPQQRSARVRARLEGIPELLQRAASRLDERLVPPELVEIAVVACTGAERFLASLDLPESAEAERRAALAAVADYTQRVHALDPGGTFATGEEVFERLLRQKHGVQQSPAELERYGHELAGETEARLGGLAEYLDGSSTWLEQVEALKRDHPTPETLLDTYAQEARRARAFVVEHDLVSVPRGESFEVRPTAPFQRATTPLGHFDRTPPFEPRDNRGILYITPIPEDVPAERQEALLQAHCFTAVRAICLHETFPGHHLQLWHAKLHGSRVRRQFSSTLFTEGWGLYTEELMEEAGYYDSPALSLWRLKNAMWRALRIVIDVGLHRGTLTLDAAARLLVDRGGLEPNTARGEVLRYTTSPTQPSSYVLGRDGIMALRTAYQAQRGPAYSLRDFHDRLMRLSSVSPAFLTPELLAAT